MRTVIIKSETITTPSIDAEGSPTDMQEIRPIIPFSEFPAGPREAGPDESGKLVWRVNVAD